VVDTLSKGGIRGPANGEVPVKEICVGGGGRLVVCGRGVGEFRGFADWRC